MTAVLHTWGQNLSQHVHLHCLIPGGALGEDRPRHGAHSTYLFPVKALSRCFRGKWSVHYGLVQPRENCIALPDAVSLGYVSMGIRVAMPQ